MDDFVHFVSGQVVLDVKHVYLLQDGEVSLYLSVLSEFTTQLEVLLWDGGSLLLCNLLCLQLLPNQWC